MKFRTSTIVLISLFMLVMATAIVFLLWVTANGIGVSPDSISYIETAESLIAGKGFYIGEKPATHYPPVYPVILAITGFVSGNITTSARWFHAILYGVNAILFGLCIYAGTRRNLAAMIVGLLLFFSSSAILSVHARAWSESPFLMFSLISYLLLNSYFIRGKWIFLVFSALSLGLVIATRYVGIALIPPAILCLYLCSKQPPKQKFKEVFGFLIISSLPILTWVIRDLVVTRSLTDRGFFYHPFGVKSAVDLVDTLHNFILPHFNEGWLNAVELAVIIALVLIMIIGIFRDPERTCRSEPGCQFNVTWGYTAALSYVLVLLFSITFIDRSTPLDERILFPAFIFMTISVFSTVLYYSKVKRNRTAWFIFLACVLFSIRINLTPLLDTANKLHTAGKGFNSAAWNQSPTLEILRSFPPDVLVFSNGDDVIRYKTGMQAEALPAKYSPTTTVPNDGFLDSLAMMCAELESEKVLLVFLNEIDRDYYPTKDEVLAACDTPLLYATKDGSIYGFSDR